MQVELPYGDGLIRADVPDGATVLRPARVPALSDPAAALSAALASPIAGAPLARIAKPGQRVAIVVSDVTRPVPNDILLPPMLSALEAAGVDRQDITIVIGTGLHRASRPDERERILGKKIPSRYRVVDHDARDRATQRPLLRAPRGFDVWLNRDYLDADIRVLTGFVEPHLFAGYSGGGKSVLPGIAGAEAIMANHDARMIGDGNATWCVTAGNPIFEEMRDIALRSGPAFTLNVTLDEQKRITGVFAGELAAAHDAAIAQAARQYVQPIPHLFDIVAATNMGYPADLSLYQSVKGMSAAAQACVPGGTIVLVAECREGLGGREYVDLMRSERSPGALLDRFGAPEHATLHDQWGVQTQAMIQARFDVWMHSSLDRQTTELAHLRYAADVDGTLAHIVAGKRAELGREPALCVLPHGQLTVPRLAPESAA